MELWRNADTALDRATQSLLEFSSLMGEEKMQGKILWEKRVKALKLMKDCFFMRKKIGKKV